MFRTVCRVLLRLVFVAVAVAVIGVALAGDGRGALERLTAGAWEGKGGAFSVKGLASAAAAELQRPIEALTRDRAEPRFQIEVARPSGPRGWACQSITPSSVELRAQTPPGWSDHELRRKRWRASLVNSGGPEEPAAGFVAGKCVVGVRARGDALSPKQAFDSVLCQKQCLADSACLGIIWGRVQTKEDGWNYRCFLSGTGETDDIIGHPCQSSFWCPQNTSYKALSWIAPTVQCWQRQLWNCPVSQEDAMSLALETAKKAGDSCKVGSNQLLDKIQDMIPWNRVQGALPQDPKSRRYVKIGLLVLAFYLLWRLLRGGQDRQLRAEASAAAVAAGAAAGPISMSPLAASKAVPHQLSAEDSALFGSWSEAPPSYAAHMEPSHASHHAVKTVASPVRSRVHEEPRSPFVQGLRQSPVASTAAKATFFPQMPPAPQSPLGVPAPQSPLGAQLLSAPSPAVLPTATLASVPEVHEMPVFVPAAPLPNDRVSVAPLPNARVPAAAPAPAAPIGPQELAVVAILNDGDLEDLKALKGLGAVSAKKILEYRKTGQQIQQLEDLVSHVGLTKKTLTSVYQNC